MCNPASHPLWPAGRQSGSGLYGSEKCSVKKTKLILLPVAAMCKLTLSGEPRPFCSILCDSLTPHPPLGKAALCMEVGFNNFSLGKFRERERASEKASNYLTPFSKQVMQLHPCAVAPLFPYKCKAAKCLSPPSKVQKGDGRWATFQEFQEVQ